MTDLHGWITQQITLTVAVAEEAADGAGSAHWRAAETASCDCCVHLRTDDGGLLCTPDSRYADHMAAHDPAAALRRCEADRKILSDHTSFGDGSVHCVGCGVDYETGPFVDNVNDCPTLLSLAEGYGLTEEQRAQLDRPEAAQVRSQPRGPMPDTSRVPPTFRGPNWRPTRKEQA